MTLWQKDRKFWHFVQARHYDYHLIIYNLKGQFTQILDFTLLWLTGLLV